MMVWMVPGLSERCSARPRPVTGKKGPESTQARAFKSATVKLDWLLKKPLYFGRSSFASASRR
jgi:hypothetical protein